MRKAVEVRRWSIKGSEYAYDSMFDAITAEELENESKVCEHWFPLTLTELKPLAVPRNHSALDAENVAQRVFGQLLDGNEVTPESIIEDIIDDLEEEFGGGEDGDRFTITPEMLRLALILLDQFVKSSVYNHRVESLCDLIYDEYVPYWCEETFRTVTIQNMAEYRAMLEAEGKRGKR